MSRDLKIRCLNRVARRVKQQMIAPETHLQVVDVGESACRTTECPLPVQGEHGRCRPCEAVYATAALLARRLASRHLARVEFELPGFEQAVLRALGLRLGSEIARPCDRAVRRSPAGDLDTDLLAPRACEVDRIERLIPELRAVQVTEVSQ